MEVLKVLEEAGISMDYIAETSIGPIMGDCIPSAMIPI